MNTSKKNKQFDQDNVASVLSSNNGDRSLLIDFESTGDQDMVDHLLDYQAESATGPAANEAVARHLQDFGRFVRSWRVATGLDRRCLAQALGVTKATVIALENGLLAARRINDPLIKRLAKQFDLEVEELYLMLGRYGAGPAPDPAGAPHSPGSPAEAPDPGYSEAQAHQLEMIPLINTLMSKALDQNEMLNTALQEAMQVISADAGVIYLLSPSLEEITLAAHWPEDDHSLRHSAEIRRTAGYIISTGELYHSFDIFEDAPLVSAIDDESFCSLLCLPIKSRRRVFGTIVATSTRPDYFTISDEQFLAAVGDHIAAALEVHILREVGLAVAQFNLRDTLIKIVQTACFLMGTERGAAVVVDRETKEPLPGAIKFPAEEFKPRPRGLTYAVASSEKPYLVFDAQTHPLVKASTKKQGIRTILGMPVNIRRKSDNRRPETIGVLFASSLNQHEFDRQDRELLQSLAGQAAVVIDNVALYELSVRERDQFYTLCTQLSVVHEIVHQVRNDQDFLDLLETAAKIANGLLSGNAVDILWQDQERERLIYYGGHRVNYQQFDYRPNPIFRDIVRQVVAEGTPLRLCDVSEHVPAQKDVLTLASTPLAVAGKTVGALTVYRNQAGQPFTKGDQEVLSLLAVQLGIAIQNALHFRKYYQHTQSLLAWHKGLLRLAGYEQLPMLVNFLLNQVVKLLDVDGGRFYLVDEQERHFTLIEATDGFDDHIGLTLPVRNSVIGQVIAKKAPVTIFDYRNWEHRIQEYDPHNFNAVVGVPIICWGRVWGALSIHDTRADRHFEARELRLMGHFGNLMAAILENAEHFFKTENNLDRLQTLIDTCDEVLENAGAMLPKERLEFIAGKMLDLLPADNCNIIVFDPADQGNTFQGKFMSNHQGQVKSVYLNSPMRITEKQAIPQLKPYGNKHLCIPWQTDYSRLGGELGGGINPYQSTLINAPLIKRDAPNEPVIGTISVKYWSKLTEPYSLVSGGFSVEDEWIIRIFADTVTLIIDENLDDYKALLNWLPGHQSDLPERHES